MAIVNIITANCENNQLSQQMVSRQWDDKGTLIQFAGYPEPEGDEALIFRLIVWMKESEDAEPRELPPILLDSDQWLISNYYTQLVQTIKFQLCITNETGTYEKHSPVFAGHIGRSLSHNGQEGDIDVIPLFDPYMNYVDEKVNDLIVAAGDVQIDASLSTSGAAADAKATGDAIAGVNGRLDQQQSNISAVETALGKTSTETENLFSGVLVDDKRWGSSPAPVHMVDQSGYKAGEFDIPLGTEKITTNYYWLDASFCYYADSNYNRIGDLVKDTIGNNYVYTVPSGATKVCFSFNHNAADLANKLSTAGIVMLVGDTVILSATIENYPYKTDEEQHYYADELLVRAKDNKSVGEILGEKVPFSEVENINENLADGTYTGNGGAAVSDNTVTVTSAYQGIFSNEFTLNNGKFKVKIKAVFNVPRCILRYQYFTTAWNTESIQDILSGSQVEAIVDVSAYSATKFRILLQNASVTSGVTNYITVETLEIYDIENIESSPYYNKNLKSFLGNLADGMGGRVYTCKKDGTGDFDSVVDAVTEACKYMDSVVYVGPGEWDVIDEFGENYMGAVSSTPSTWGLVLKNRVHLIGTAKTVIKAVNNSESTNFENIKTYFSVFNAGEKGFTLENINIEDENVRYSVHDDRGGSGPEPYTNKYIRCSMIHKNGKYSDCIGAGLGENQTVEIRGCYFEGDLGRTRLVYWHGNNNSQVTDALGKLTVCDNYFAQDGTFMMTKYGQSDTDTVAYVSNNSFGTAPSVNSGSVAPYDNIRIVAWNNEVRTI